MEQVSWLPTSALCPPHGVSHPDHVIELANHFVERGWDPSCPALIGYPWEQGVQLLSGSHRWIAAGMAEILVPVVVVPFSEVEDSWGDLDKWKRLMRRGDGVLGVKTTDESPLRS
jgi:hypothetical protein